MATTEQIRILLVKCGNMSESELARKLGISPQNLHNKLKRDNFTQEDLKGIAKALNVNYESYFLIPDTGEKI